MQINLSELFPIEGMSKQYQVPFEEKEIKWNKNRYPVTEAGEVSLTIVHTENHKMKLTGEVDLRVEIPCDRCLQPVDIPFHLTLEREIDTNITEQQRIAALDEQPFVQGYLLDIDRLVYNEVILNMPMKVLCRDDCKGLCPECGANRNLCDCCCCGNLTRLDLRMSMILDVFNDAGRQDS